MIVEGHSGRIEQEHDTNVAARLTAVLVVHRIDLAPLVARAAGGRVELENDVLVRCQRGRRDGDGLCCRVDREVVVDGNWVSSRKPDDIPAFNRAMIDVFAQRMRDSVRGTPDEGAVGIATS